MAFRLLQDHLRDLEKRVGPASHLDLFGQRLDSAIVGNERAVYFRQRGRWGSLAIKFATWFASSRAAALRSAIAWPTTTAFGGTWGREWTIASRAASCGLIAASSRMV